MSQLYHTSVKVDPSESEATLQSQGTKIKPGSAIQEKPMQENVRQEQNHI